MNNLSRLCEYLIVLQVPRQICLNALKTIQLNYNFEQKIWNNILKRFERNYAMRFALDRFKSRRREGVQIPKLEVLLLASEYLGSWKERLVLLQLSQKHKKYLAPRFYRAVLLQEPVLGKERFHMWKTVLEEVR